jgi:GNAT superfamily N-acetyltransferase
MTGRMTSRETHRPATPPYTIRPLEPADEPAVLELLGASLAGGPTGRRTAEFFHWKHVANSFGRSPGLVAEQDGEVIGLRLFLRWEFRAGDQVIRAVRPVDTATHPEHQGRGIFKALTLSALDQLQADTDLVFNTPNEKSMPGYLKMGWQVVGTVPIAIRPVRPITFARQFRAATRGAPSGPPPVCPLPPAASILDRSDELDALVAEVGAGDPRLRTRLSLDYLRWRYVEAPDLDYRVISVDGPGGLAGVAFARARRRGALAELTLSELLVRPGDRRSAGRLLRAATRAGCDHVATHLARGTELSAPGRRNGYLTTSRVGMVLTSRPLRELPANPLDLASWRFALGDLEVF